MTALDKYQRLEGPAVWRAAPDALRRNVVVSLGKSTLVISDPRSGEALSHWALTAVSRLGRGSEPAVYVPGVDEPGEELEVDDLTLIEALETIQAALRPRPPARWIRAALGAASAVVVLGGALFLPDAIARHTAEIVPEATRGEIAREALDAMAASAAGERVCAHPDGRQSLAALRDRVLGPEWRIRVITGGSGFETAHLPGNMILVGSDLLDRLNSPEALAGWLISEAVAAQRGDPMLEALRYAGTRATIALLTSGNLPVDALQGYVRTRMDAGRAPFAEPDVFRQRLGVLGVSTFAFAQSVAGFDDPLAQALASAPDPGSPPLLSDGAWLTLQAICTR